MAFERDDYCSVMHDEIKADQERTAQEMLYETALQQAQNEFNYGELDSDIHEMVADNPIDAAAIALHAMFGDHKKNLYRVRFIPSEVDFVAQVEEIIERRAKAILEDMS